MFLILCICIGIFCLLASSSKPIKQSQSTIRSKELSNWNMTKTDKVIDLIIQFSQLGYDFEQDNQGQIIIYTGMKFDEKGNIIPIEDEE